MLDTPSLWLIFTVSAIRGAFSVIAVVLAIRLRRKIAPYFRAALLIALAITGIDLIGLVYVDSPMGMLGIAGFIAGRVLQVVVLATMISVGIVVSLDQQIRPSSLMIASDAGFTTRPNASWWIWPGTILGAAVTLYSTLLFLLLNPAPGETVEWAAEQNLASGFAFSLAVIILLVPVAEEILFRLGIQNLVSRVLRTTGRAYWVSIVISASIWTLSHTGSLTPDWVKYAQMFPIGIAFGILYRYRGIEACIVAHVSLNLLMTLASHVLFPQLAIQTG